MSGARTVTLALLAAAFLAGSAAVAQDPPADAAEPLTTVDRDALGRPTEEGAAEEEREGHKGFLFRFTIGLGWAWINGDGPLEPAIGLRRVDDPKHTSPAFNASMDIGGGFKNLGIHVGGAYERMILRADSPTEMGFTLLGVGGGLSYYFTEHDFYATAQIRFVGLLLYLPGVMCDAKRSEKYQSYQGPGLTVGLGKEWFGDNDKGLGLGLQLNYARLKNDPWAEFDYVSLMLALTFTKF